MASIKPVSSKIISTKTTGYMALGSLSVAAYSSISKSPAIRKHHKSFGILAYSLTLFHLFTSIYSKYKFNKQNTLK